MWRYGILLLVILTSCISLAHADDVLIFAGRDSVLLTNFQLVVNENQYLIIAVSPSNGTAVDRDGLDHIDPTVIPLSISVPANIPDGTSITFVGSLVNPSIAGQTNMVLGYNNTSSNIATLYYKPNATTYAGSWDWWGASLTGIDSNSLTFTVKGHVDTEFASGVDPIVTYFENDIVHVVANVTSSGPETRAELSTNYSLLVTSALQSPTGDLDSKTASYTGPTWNATHRLLDIGGVGTWRASVTSTNAYWYDNVTNRTFTVYGFMNITQNSTQPSTISNTGTTTSICRIQNQYTSVNVTGANVSFFRDGIFLGSNITNSTGYATITHQMNSTGTFTITCNVTDQASILYYRGNAPERNSTLTVSALSPVLQGVISDGSDSASPTNIGNNVIFTVNATDFQNDSWYLLICNGTVGTTNGLCTGNQLCISTYTPSGTNASCSFNTAGVAAWNVSWFGYACNNETSCSAFENSTAPFFVNHAPTNAPTLSPSNPTTTQNITCIPNNADPDPAASFTNTYRWFKQSKSAGPYNLIVGASSDTLNYSNYLSNDRIICESTPIDNYGLSGFSINTSIGTVQNGTVSATSNLITTPVFRTYSSSITGSCTITNGDTASMNLILQDNHTGAYATTSTVTAAVYANASSVSLGSMNATTSPTQTFTIHTSTAGNYSFRVECQASEGNPGQAYSSPQNLEVRVDTTPPVITNVQSTSLTTTSATILWDTNKIADSTVAYGLASTILNQSIVDPTQVLSHAIVLTPLQASTTYYYNVTSCNTDGYCSSTSAASFGTLSNGVNASINTHGYCTGRLVENSTPAINGVIKKGDVYEFWCELPNRVTPNHDVTLTVTNKDLQVRQQLNTPALTSTSQVVLYP